MSIHSYGRCWLHIVWTTASRRAVLTSDAGRRVALFLKDYSKEKDLGLRNVYVNADHVHVLIGLDPAMSPADAVKLLKGASSRWINLQRLTAHPFSWGRGYGVFSVSRSDINRIGTYIAEQEAHHARRTVSEEISELFPAWIEETVETVPSSDNPSFTPR